MSTSFFELLQVSIGNREGVIGTGTADPLHH